MGWVCGVGVEVTVCHGVCLVDEVRREIGVSIPLGALTMSSYLRRLLSNGVVIDEA